MTSMETETKAEEPQSTKELDNLKTKLSNDTNLNNITGSFKKFGLDSRIINSLIKVGLIKATLIQQKTIPIILSGKDVLLRAKTGSGKTLAYLIPLIQNIINFLSQNNNNRSILSPISIILAPSRELLIQIGNVLNDLLLYLNDINYYILKQFGSNIDKTDVNRLKEVPNIVIATPAQLAVHLKEGNIELKECKCIIVDEADLIITHNYQKDVQIIGEYINKKTQIIMCSATLNTKTDQLKKYFLMNNETSLELDKDGFDENKLTEYYMKCNNYNDKFLIIYALFKLNIIKGKCLVFCHSIGLTYRLKLFLEKFLIKTAVLNTKLPFNSRQSVIDKFNRDMFKYLITTDLFDEYKNGINNNIDSNDEVIDNNNNDNKKDDFIGYRGVDFREVSCVINFSSPSWLKKYIHRVGRTARAGNYGVAITLCTEKEFPRFKNVMYGRRINKNNNIDNDTDMNDNNNNNSIIDKYINDNNNNKFESLIKPLPLNMNDLQPFAYRCNSVRCSITPRLIKLAMINEIKMELLNSKRLESHFKERKRDYELLKHDTNLQPSAMIKPYFSQLPSYLIDDNLKEQMSKNNKLWNKSGTDQFKEQFNTLPYVIKNNQRKNRLRKKMKYNPKLKKQVLTRRLFNRKKGLTNFANQCHKMDKEKKGFFIFNKTTLGKPIKPKIKDKRVFLKPKSWKREMKTHGVATGKRKPGMRGMSKSQARMLKKRQKNKKLAHRRKGK